MKTSNMICSQNGCMNDYNPELSQLVKVVGLAVWIYRCDEHARTHRWAKFGGAKQWYCPECKCTHETERETDHPPKGPCILVSEVIEHVEVTT